MNTCISNSVSIWCRWNELYSQKVLRTVGLWKLGLTWSRNATSMGRFSTNVLIRIYITKYLSNSVIFRWAVRIKVFWTLSRKLLDIYSAVNFHHIRFQSQEHITICENDPGFYQVCGHVTCPQYQYQMDGLMLCGSFMCNYYLEYTWYLNENDEWRQKYNPKYVSQGKI